MLEVSAALTPGIVVSYWQFGPGTLIQLFIAVLTAVLLESAVMMLRTRKVWPTISDGSAMLTGMLLALSIPPLSPWWIATVGVVFAILLGKQVYGGLGQNPFNPAMVGYAVLLISFPHPMTSWVPPLELMPNAIDFPSAWSLIFHPDLMATTNMDVMAMATPLDTGKTGLTTNLSMDEIHTGSVFAGIGGKGWQWLNLAYLLGGLWLLQRRIISFQIPFGFLASLGAGGFFLYLVNPLTQPTPLFHLFSGATMLGAFFIATDPVTAATSPRGRWLYGLAIGFLVLMIRAYGGYPDGVAFAVLLLNFAVPTIDRFTRPRIYGELK